MPLQMVTADVQQFFQRAQWNSLAFLEIMQKYDATPEMFYHRLTNVLPEKFGIKKDEIITLIIGWGLPSKPTWGWWMNEIPLIGRTFNV